MVEQPLPWGREMVSLTMMPMVMPESKSKKTGKGCLYVGRTECSHMTVHRVERNVSGMVLREVRQDTSVGEAEKQMVKLKLLA